MLRPIGARVQQRLGPGCPGRHGICGGAPQGGGQGRTGIAFRFGARQNRIMFAAMRHKGLALVTMLLLALGATGLAHRAPSVSAEELASLLRLGITLDDICGMADMEGGGDPCPLCRIEPGWLPTAYERPAGQALVFVAELVPAPVASPPVPGRARLGKGPRGPPLA